jgi:hypothetical protein
MPNTYINKLIVGEEVKFDLTQDDITPEKLAKGIKAHDKSGAPIVGTSTFDADTKDATATAAEILLGKTAYKAGAKITGTMPNNGAKTLNITKKATPVTIPMGFHDGSGKAQIDPTEAAKIIPENIRDGIAILGVTGTMSGTEDAKPQAKTVTPTFEAQEVTPDSPDYNYLSSVLVNAIPVTYTDNEAGGQTVKIGA